MIYMSDISKNNINKMRTVYANDFRRSYVDHLEKKMDALQDQMILQRTVPEQCKIGR